ncbi:hypothetical protein HOG21_05300 [bacterium]|nr:hypothetical protein [bacterium]
MLEYLINNPDKVLIYTIVFIVSIYLVLKLIKYIKIKRMSPYDKDTFKFI